MFRSGLTALALIMCAGAVPAAEPVRGAVTNLPIPRYVSIKVAEANVRRGPSLNHRIDWVFQRRHLPVEVTAEHGNWRRVRDMEGAGGWVHYSLLSGARYVIVTGDTAALFQRPDPDAPLVARAEPGVIAQLGNCGPDWCRITAERRRGWVRRAALWGLADGEIRE